VSAATHSGGHRRWLAALAISCLLLAEGEI
jgi:hypothetical protein